MARIVDYKGFRFPSLDLKDHDKWIQNVEKLELVWEFVDQWDVAIDCGAALGLYTKRLLTRFKRVYAYEPVPINYECLIENAKHEGLVSYQLAVGEKEGERAIKINAAGMMKIGEGHKVNVVSLDRHLPNLSGVGLIKLDIEGMELEALRGAQGIIESNKPAIFIEVKYDRKSIGKLLNNMKYQQVWTDRVDSIYVRWDRIKY